MPCIPHSLEITRNKVLPVIAFPRGYFHLTKLQKPPPHASTVTTPSGLIVIKLFACGPHSTAVAGTAVLMTSDHDFELFVYCEIVRPRGPEAARYCPVKSHRILSTWPPISRTFASAAFPSFRKSKITILVEPFATAANQMPFSENEISWTGPPNSKFAALSPVLTWKSLIWPSAPPAANRCPSGWNAATLRPTYMISLGSFAM